MPTVMLCYRLMCRPLTVIIPFLYSPRCWAFLYVGASVFFIQHMLWIYVTLTWTSADPPHPLTGRHDTALDTLIKPQLRLMDRALNMIRRQQGGMAPPNARLVHARHFSAHCHVYVDPPGGGNLTQGDDSRLFNIAAFTPPPPPFKVYVYDLPDEFNVDRVSCVNRKHYGDGCADLGFCGAGVRLKNETAHLFLHDTWQFSLEVLLHHKMLYSTYRTSNASEASLLYVPYYPGLDCICEEGAGTMGAGRVAARIYRLFKYLRSTGLYPGRNPQGGSPSPHLMGLGKIQREHFTPSCPLLRHPDARNFIFAGIEEEGSSARRAIHRSIGVRPMVVMPYPSYAHLNTFSGTLPMSIASYRRHVFLFLAAGRRRSNPFRAKILNQFADHSTTLSHSESFPETKHYPELLPERDRVWLITDECRGDHKYHTIQWMTHSIFCLQPPGDSPTRKSFYDAVLSGCIPVLFAMPHGRDSSTAATRYPFSETQLRYADFTVTVPFGESDVFRFLHAIPMPHIWEMRNEVLKAAPYLQYSLPIANTPHNDAIKCMLEELQYKHLQL